MGAVELPFLYRTRTILRCSQRVSKVPVGPRRPRLHRWISVESDFHAEEPAESFPAQKARESAEHTQSRSKHSITRTEKKVFDRIFHDIKQPANKTAVSWHDAGETDPHALLRLFLEEPGDRQALNSVPEPKPRGGKSFHASKTNFQEHIRRYPSALRHAALQATPPQPPADWPHNLPYQSFQPSEVESPPSLVAPAKTRDPRHGVYRPLDAPLETTVGEAEPATGPELRNFNAIKEDEIAQGSFRGKTADYVEAQLKSISAELQACISSGSQAGAFKIWEICQTRIFPIVQTTSPKTVSERASEAPAAKDSDESRKPAKRAAKRQTAAKSEPLPETPTPPVKLPSGVSRLTVQTTLYPTLTLLALRLLCTHYPTTPFPLTLYHRVHALNAESRILGLNVHFYNTLLRHLWDVYSDFNRMAELLGEMQKGCVEGDEHTYGVIGCVEEERWLEVKQREGSRGPGWWERPAQARGWARLMEWKQVVAGQLQERGMGGVVSEREYVGELREDGLVAGRPGVWL